MCSNIQCPGCIWMYTAPPLYLNFWRTKGLTWLEECLIGRGALVGPITDQGSGLGGGRVLIIGGISSRKLSSFVSNSSVLRCLPGFVCFLKTHIHLTSPWDSPVDFTAREGESLHNWSMINTIKYSHQWQWREGAALCPWHLHCVLH